MQVYVSSGELAHKIVIEGDLLTKSGSELSARIEHLLAHELGHSVVRMYFAEMDPKPPPAYDWGAAIEAELFHQPEPVSVSSMMAGRIEDSHVVIAVDESPHGEARVGMDIGFAIFYGRPVLLLVNSAGGAIDPTTWGPLLTTNNPAGVVEPYCYQGADDAEQAVRTFLDKHADERTVLTSKV